MVTYHFDRDPLCYAEGVIAGLMTKAKVEIMTKAFTFDVNVSIPLENVQKKIIIPLENVQKKMIIPLDYIQKKIIIPLDNVPTRA